MTGAGLFPAGFGYYGFGAVPDPNSETGAVGGASYVDQNGDYEQDGTGDVVKTTPTMHRALILLRTVKGSVPHDANLGLETQVAVDATWETRMRHAVERALSPMVDDSSIRIERIDVARPLHFRASICVTYTVLATGISETAKVY